MLQNHRADQELACHGCKEFFKSASGLMRHIEDNECSVISQTRLLQEKSKKLMIKEVLKAGEGNPMPVVPEHSDLDDIDGGVKVDRLEATNREAMMHQPKPGQDDPTSSVDAMLGLKHWPKLSDKENVAPRYNNGLGHRVGRVGSKYARVCHDKVAHKQVYSLAFRSEKTALAIYVQYSRIILLYTCVARSSCAREINSPTVCACAMSPGPRITSGSCGP